MSFRRIIRYSLLAVAGLVLLVAALFGFVQTGPGKRLLADIVGALASGNGLIVTVADIDGFVPARMHIGRIELSDAKGKFAGDIVATLQTLGTNQSGIAALASVAVTHGDFLHLDVSIPNTGTGGGNNAAASFPNGRRLQDDVIDILLNIITNGALTTGDNVNANDVSFGNTFPFLAPSQQPRAPGVTDDNTRN